VHDLENRPMTRMSPRRSYPPRIAIAVAMAMLVAGCTSSPEARPTEPTSKVDGCTTALSPQPASTIEGPIGQVGGWIAYSSADGICAVDPARPERRIRLSRGDDDPIAWSSDGTKLLIRRRAPRGADLYVLEADGTETRLTDADTSGAYGWFSPDGFEVVYATRSAIYAVSSDGGAPRLIHRVLDSDSGGSFSPDGSEFVYATRRAIYAVSLDGGTPRLILRATRRVGGALAGVEGTALSPDGTQIAYFDGMGDHSHHLWVMNADGTERRPLLDDEVSGVGHVGGLAWSPDGEWLAFKATVNGEIGIYLVRPDGSGLTQLVPGSVAVLRWSPDGSRIAYRVQHALWIANLDGSNERIVEGIGEESIAWNPAV
jgi:Tol biopolymer transport system component